MLFYECARFLAAIFEISWSSFYDFYIDKRIGHDIF